MYYIEHIFNEDDYDYVKNPLEPEKIRNRYLDWLLKDLGWLSPEEVWRNKTWEQNEWIKNISETAAISAGVFTLTIIAGRIILTAGEVIIREA